MASNEEEHKRATRLACFGRSTNTGKKWTHEVVATYPDGRVFVVKRCMSGESAEYARRLAIRRTAKPFVGGRKGPTYSIRPYEPAR